MLTIAWLVLGLAAGATPRTYDLNDIPLVRFQEAIHAAHGAQAQLVTHERVSETFLGHAIWEVLVFTLEGHPTASLCYAWEVDGKVTAVLHEGPVDGPLAAVRAAILTEEE